LNSARLSSDTSRFGYNHNNIKQKYEDVDVYIHILKIMGITFNCSRCKNTMEKYHEFLDEFAKMKNTQEYVSKLTEKHFL